ncbi:MarR family transcriptional regulator [Shimia sp. NS0008-38b]|uniref:MarR family winged helix-turn-helix transcriptional regulator n=1 Tax=Shimia sp. NS0008-38b TaxID=3127653 RepID=UPI00310C38FB
MTNNRAKITTQTPNAAFFDDDDPNIAYSRVWFYVLKSQRKFFLKFSQVLKEAGLGDPVWYEILYEIDQGGEGGKLMGNLEAKLLLPQYGLSRHVSRMETAGLIRRNYITDGRRKQVLFLTDVGAARMKEVWPLYLDTLKSEMGPLLHTDEAYDLARFLLRLLR